MFKVARKSSKQKNNKLMSAQDIVKHYSITYQTVNHYTDFGLLPVAGKQGNVRCYDRGLVGKRLKTIQALAKEGYSLRLIRKQLLGI